MRIFLRHHAAFQLGCIAFVIALSSGMIFAKDGDLDNDGVPDSAETNTGIYVSPTNTGTNPSTADTDGDGVPDGIELKFGTNPADPASFTKRPNIIFILTDDLGIGDLGSFWQNQKLGTQKFATPGLDSLASEGVLLTHHYSGAPICGSSRASLLTGKDQGSCDIRDDQFDKALPNDHTLARVLKGAGYTTFHIGKSGVTSRIADNLMTGTGSQNIPAHPMARGFDHFFGYYTHSAGWEHYPRNGTTIQKAFIYNDYQQITDAYVDLYTTDAWTGYAKKTIIDETQNHPNRPFFIYLAHDAPHCFLQYPPTRDYPTGSGVNGGVRWVGAPAYVNTATNDPNKVDNVANAHPATLSTWPAYARQHASMVRRLDNSVSDIVQTLKDLHIDNNTLIVFTSDNGAHHEIPYDPRFFESYGNFEGVKRDLWEGGIHVPAIVWWPGKIQPTSLEKGFPAISTPSAFWDWMATFADIAGVPCPSSSTGESILPALTGSPFQRVHNHLYFEFFINSIADTTPQWSAFPNHAGNIRQQMQAIRIGNYKGVRTNILSGQENFKIYDVVNDPKESHQVAGLHPEIQAKMKDLALTSRKTGLLAGVTRPYDSIPLPACGPLPTLTQGTSLKLYTGNWPWLPKFENLPPISQQTVSAINATKLPRAGTSGLMFECFIYVPTTGSYTFRTNSSGPVSIWLHERQIMDNDFTFFAARNSDAVLLEKGFHPFRLSMMNLTASPSLTLSYFGPGFTIQDIPTTSLFTPARDSTTGALSVAINQSAYIDPAAEFTAASIQNASSNVVGRTSIVNDTIQYNTSPNYLGFDQITYSLLDSFQSRFSQATEVRVLFKDEIWLPLDDTQGNLINGYSNQHSYTGLIPSGGPIRHSGVNGSSLAFSGSGTPLAVNTSPLPSNSGAFSISLWVKNSENSSSREETFLSFQSSMNTSRTRCMLVPDPSQPTSLFPAIECDAFRYTSDSRLNDGQWHHLVWSIPTPVGSGSGARNVILNIDGQTVTIIAQNALTQSSGSTDQIFLGADVGQSTSFTGELDEVRIFPSFLLPTEAARIYAANFNINAVTPIIPDPPAIVTTVDSDGDGITDVNEAIAGTNPLDPQSSFKFTSTLVKADGISLSWIGHSGRVYQIQESDDLRSWHPVAGIAPLVSTVDGTLQSVTVPSVPVAQRFLRVSVMIQN